MSGLCGPISSDPSADFGFLHAGSTLSPERDTLFCWEKASGLQGTMPRLGDSHFNF